MARLRDRNTVNRCLAALVAASGVSGMARTSLAEPLSVTVAGDAAPRSASEVTVKKRVLSAAPHKNAGELLLVVPGVSVSQHSGEGKAHQVFFRGFDAVHGQDIEFWAAGAPVNDVSNIHGQGYADLHFLIPEVVKEIRASAGNYDPQQGDFAVAGTMRYSLGYDEPGVTASGGLGSFGARRYLLVYHPEGTSGENFGASEFASSDGFGPSRAARHGSAIAQTTFRMNDSTSARVMASAYAGRFDSAGVVPLAAVESGSLSRFGTYDAKQGGASARTQVVAELMSQRQGDDGSPRDSSGMSTFLVLRSLSLRSNFTGFLTSKEGDSIQQTNDATTVGATAFYRRTLTLLSRRDSLEAGIFLRADSIEQSQHQLSFLDDRVTDSSLHPGVQASVSALNAASYLDANLHPWRPVVLRGGLRLDNLSYTAQDTGTGAGGQARTSLGGQLSKRANVDINLVPGLNALLSYGEGFRSPQARSLSDGETTPFTRVVSYETGLRFRDETRFQSAIALYRTRLSDDLVFDQSSARNVSVPGTVRTGITANLTAAPNSWFVSSLSATYAHAVFAERGGAYEVGDLLPYVPQYVVRSDLAVTPVLGRVAGNKVESQLGVGLTYEGRRPLPYSEFGHDVFLADASVAVRVGNVRTSLDVFNLLNLNWFDGEFVYGSSFAGAPSLVPTRHVSVGAPRTLFWTLTLFI